MSSPHFWQNKDYALFHNRGRIVVTALRIMAPIRIDLASIEFVSFTRCKVSWQQAVGYLEMQMKKNLFEAGWPKMCGIFVVVNQFSASESHESDLEQLIFVEVAACCLLLT